VRDIQVKLTRMTRMGGMVGWGGVVWLPMTTELTSQSEGAGNEKKQQEYVCVISQYNQHQTN
jgi:hypothetical protein